ncbi:MAG: sugar transferase [Nitrospira sp.]|nr:sugar transferase [Nitrospira sp.]MBX3339086.1 sugar transferase [Nitrospira sp.]MCW5777996.1 sugar transferase [Nitrospira sp.]HNO35657.1 sugar transferase [Nitrospira sp.]
MPSEHDYLGRRLLDVCGAAAGLLCLLPLFLLISIWIKIDSKGPVFYRAIRLGRYGKPFQMFKFRSMRADADKVGALITPDKDSRVTRVGGFLRKFKLDELPQLINVLKGEMSLVGPRPEAALYFDYYSPDEKRAVLSVRPGMTDYGSLRFHDEGRLLAGSADPIQTYLDLIREPKVRAQLEYIRDQSLLLDIKIIFRTIGVVATTRMKDVA